MTYILIWKNIVLQNHIIDRKFSPIHSFWSSIAHVGKKDILPKAWSFYAVVGLLFYSKIKSLEKVRKHLVFYVKTVILTKVKPYRYFIHFNVFIVEYCWILNLMISRTLKQFFFSFFFSVLGETDTRKVIGRSL